MIQSVPEQQLLLEFPDSKPFVPPPFRRDIAPAKANLPGISPRDGFEFAQELIQQGVGEDEIAPKLVEFVDREQQRIRTLLMRLTNTMLAIDYDQKKHAADLDRSLQELSELSIAWWLFEMNLTRITDAPEKNSWPSVMRLIKNFRVEMGKFRTFMESEYGITRQ